MSELKNDYKAVEIDGVKYLEKSEKITMKAKNYGSKVIKGAEIEGLANIPISFKIDQSKDYVLLAGYLNNKLIPGTDLPAQDSYGDIPTGKNVYDLERLINNPIALINHDNDASSISGNFIYLKEDKQGLQFKEVLRPLDEVFADRTKDAISAWSNGWGVAYSIGGRWLYDWDKSDPATNTYVLVKAILHEASHVAIGADKWALSIVPDISMVETEKGEVTQCETLEEALSKYIESDDIKYLSQIEKFIKKGEN